MLPYIIKNNTNLATYLSISKSIIEILNNFSCGAEIKYFSILLINFYILYKNN